MCSRYIYICISIYVYIDIYALSLARSGLAKTESDWGAFFEQLKAFKARCAHAHVSERTVAYSRVHTWAFKARYAYADVCRCAHAHVPEPYSSI